MPKSRLRGPHSFQVAKWVYQQTGKANGQVWVIEKVLRHLSTNWLQCFAV